MTAPSSPVPSCKAGGERLHLRADAVTVRQRYRKDLGSIDSLAASIENVGLIHPIVVDKNNVLIAGERRLAACLRLGMTEVPVTVVDVAGDAQRLRIEMDENTARADFTPTEAVAIAEAVREAEARKAKERMVTAHASPAKFAQQDRGETREKAAALTGYSHETIRKAKTVVEAAAEDPLLEPVVEEMDRTGKVDPAYRKVKRATQPTETSIAERRKLAGQKAAETHSRNRHKKMVGVWLEDPEANERVRRALAEVVSLMDGLGFWETYRNELEGVLMYANAMSRDAGQSEAVDRP